MFKLGTNYQIMKLVILAGGLGTRLSEETHLRPKPMVEIGGKPILWHIMKCYSTYGINEFIICCGYKGYVIKEYFANYFLHSNDVTFHMNKGNKVEFHRKKVEPWKVTLVDTGDDSQTGGRLYRVSNYLDDEPFCFTYGDGLADIDIHSLIEFHKNNKSLATLTAVQPPGRYGALNIDDIQVKSFIEKADSSDAWINAGFFVLDPKVISYIKNEQVSWEFDILPKLSNEQQLTAYKHYGFWQPMDTLRDKYRLEELWQSGNAKWKNWK